MSNRYPWWPRILLGTSLSIAIALIMVVVSSRPSWPQHTSPLATAAAGPEAALARSGASVAPALHGAPEHEEAMKRSEVAVSLAVRQPTAEFPVPGEKPSLAVTPPAVVAAAEFPVADSGAASPTGHAGVPPYEIPVATGASAPKAKGPASARRDADAVAGPGSTTEDRQAPSGRHDEPARTDPRQRLAREFARRAAAKDAQRTQPIAATPPADEILPPAVVMSQAHRESCRVFMGDAMPDATLPDTSAGACGVHKSFGKQLTVIVFWSELNPYAREQFRRLPHELVPFAPLGVAVIAVHVGPQPDNYHDLCQPLGRDVLCLLDGDGKYFQQIADGRVPRTYVLDADGRVIWLDIEYSQTTRHDLDNALHFALRAGDRGER